MKAIVKLLKEAVKLSSEINPTGRTSTQPNITTNKAEGYLLFFSSNKLGGMGGMDLWMCKRKSQNQYHLESLLPVP